MSHCFLMWYVPSDPLDRAIWSGSGRTTVVIGHKTEVVDVLCQLTKVLCQEHTGNITLHKHICSEPV